MPTKFVPPTWVSAWAAVNTVAQRLSLHKDGVEDGAVGALTQAMLSGDIPARGNGFVLAKDQLKQMRDESGGLPLRDLEIQRLGLEAWLTGNDAKPITANKRGPKASWDWDRCWASICSKIAKEGLPLKQASVEQMFLDWFQAHQGGEPAISEVRKRAAMLYADN